MRRYRQSLTLSLFATAVLALAVTAGCSFSEEGKAKEAPCPPKQHPYLGAAGSTFIAPLMDALGQQLRAGSSRSRQLSTHRQRRWYRRN